MKIIRQGDVLLVAKQLPKSATPATPDHATDAIRRSGYYPDALLLKDVRETLAAPRGYLSEQIRRMHNQINRFGVFIGWRCEFSLDLYP